MLSDSDKHYLGGIIDGEGSILIAKRGMRYDGILTVGMTDGYPIKLLSTVLKSPYHYKTENGRTIYILHIGARKCQRLLIELIPYIRTKRREALLVLGLFKLRDWKKRYLIEKNKKILHAKYGGPRLIPNKILGDGYFIRAHALYTHCKAIKKQERLVLG